MAVNDYDPSESLISQHLADPLRFRGSPFETPRVRTFIQTSTTSHVYSRVESANPSPNPDGNLQSTPAVGIFARHPGRPHEQNFRESATAPKDVASVLARHIPASKIGYVPNPAPGAFPSQSATPSPPSRFISLATLHPR